MCMLNAVAHQSSMQELDLLNPQLDPRITFTRASTKTYFGADGLMHVAAADEWPLEYDPITLQPLGRSVWEQRTNLLLNSDTLATQSVTVTAQAYTLTFYGTGTITLSGAYSGSLVGAGAFPTRSTLTFTPSAGTLTLTVSGSVPKAQLEAGAFASPYIPTAGSQVTRVADVAYCAAADMGFNPTGSTLVVQKQYAANVLGFTYGRGNSQLLRLSTGSNGSTNFRNQIVLGANRVGGPTSPKYLNARFRDLDGTGYDVNVDLDALSSGPPLDDTSPVVAALSFKKGEFVALAARGVAKRVNDAAVPTFNFTDLNLSQAYDGTTFCGWIKSCRVYPSGVSKEELEALTA